jgi:hypothetical protein
MSDKELNLPNYINFAYNRFIMTRVEYLIFTQNEQESKVLRTIEWCIENERGRLYREAMGRTLPGQKVEIPDIIWVAISHSFFMGQLHGTIQSLTTLKDTLSSLKEKHFIFQEEGAGGPYDPPIYTINKHLLAKLTQLLPPSLDDLDMIAIMKKEREIKKPREGQKLTPSKIDPLVLKIREAIFAPLDSQLLALYSPKIDPLSRSAGGQKLAPIIYKEKSKKENKEVSITADADTSLSSLSDEDLLAELQRRGISPSTVPNNPTRSRKSTQTTLTPEEQIIYDFYAHLVAIPPSVNEATKKYCAALIPFVKSQEDMDSLEKFTHANHPFKTKVIYLGNLVNGVNAWLREKGTQGEEAPDQIYWNTTGKKRCMDPDLWGWMSMSEALSFGYSPELKLTDREIRDTETRKQMKRENAERKARTLEQETTHG